MKGFRADQEEREGEGGKERRDGNLRKGC